jgi:alpha-mannosidase
MQTALGMVTPAPAVAVDRGPPHVGQEGWLYHLDAPNLLLTSLRPGPGGADGVVARLLECAGHGSAAELRCVRDPVRASLLDAAGSPLTEAAIRGDAVVLDVAPNDLVSLRVDFS